MTHSNFTFSGISGDILNYAHSMGKKNEIAFFKPFHTAKDGFISASSIVTAPLISSGMSVLSVLIVGGGILGTIGCCLIGKFSLADKFLEETIEAAYFGVLHLINILLSPLANLIDFLGSVINTVYQAVNEPTVDNAPAI
jgi:hypothetical protein